MWMTRTASLLSHSMSRNIWTVCTQKNVTFFLFFTVNIAARLWSCVWKSNYYLKRISSLWVLCVQVWDVQQSHPSHDLGHHLAALHIWGRSRGQEERAYAIISAHFTAQVHNIHPSVLGPPEQTRRLVISTVQRPYLNMKRCRLRKAPALCWICQNSGFIFNVLTVLWVNLLVKAISHTVVS